MHSIFNSVSTTFLYAGFFDLTAFAIILIGFMPCTAKSELNKNSYAASFDPIYAKLLLDPRIQKKLVISDQQKESITMILIEFNKDLLQNLNPNDNSIFSEKTNLSKTTENNLELKSLKENYTEQFLSILSSNQLELFLEYYLQARFFNDATSVFFMNIVQDKIGLSSKQIDQLKVIQNHFNSDRLSAFQEEQKNASKISGDSVETIMQLRSSYTRLKEKQNQLGNTSLDDVLKILTHEQWLKFQQMLGQDFLVNNTYFLTRMTTKTKDEQFTFNKQDPSKQSITEIKPPVKAPITPENINEYYGVVAVSQNTGRYGFCFAHHKDKQEAANHALSFCNSRDAKVVLCVKNSWFALASGGGGAFGWAHGSDPDEVRERAINECLRFSNTAQIVVLDHSNNKNHLNQSLKSTSTKPGWDKSDVSSDIKNDYDKILNSHHKGFISELKNTFAEFPDIRISVWKNAAEIGNTHAMVLYAKHLEYAQTPDLEKSFNYMKKAAQNEDAFAMTELAYFYIYGKGIPKNIDEGIQWLRKASELEDPQAMSSLAYYFRDKYKDSENSFFWAKKGSNLGNTNAIIQLAHCYYHGFGVDKNEAECFRLYLKAADLGNSLSVNNVGVCYAKGIGVDKDDKKSYEMYLKSAELGLLLGMYNVANCYKNGKGTSEDREKAIEWYKKSAKYGEERSRKTLKEMGIDY
jgi:TPR repeat protein